MSSTEYIRPTDGADEHEAPHAHHDHHGHDHHGHDHADVQDDVVADVSADAQTEAGTPDVRKED